MVRYLKLALDGYGCFSGRAEFSFPGGIGTLSLPNEAGKSMMLNGLIHTIFGMDKKAKDRFRPWGGAALSRGELIIASDGVSYVIRMDFAADKVEVLLKDEATGLLSPLIPNHSHVPGGRRSQRYMEFLSGVFGTADEDAFRAAYVIEQPVSGEFALGAGKELLTGQGSALLEKSLKALTDRLGKEKGGITRYMEEYDAESSRQQKDRRLEQLREKKAEISAMLRRSMSKLDEIQPAKEALARAKEDLAAARAQLKDVEEGRHRVQKWWDLREECRIRQKEAAEAAGYLDAVNREEDALKALKLVSAGDSFKKQEAAYEAHLVDSLEKAAMDAGQLLRESEGLASSSYAAGLPSGSGLLAPEAEGLLRKAEDDARGSAAELRGRIDAASGWQRRYSEVSGMDDEARRRLELIIEGASASVKGGRRSISPAVAIAALAGLACVTCGAFLHMTWLAVAGASALAIAALLFFISSRGKGEDPAGAAASSEAISEAKRLAALYDSMFASERPSIPEGAEAQLDLLIRRADAADSLARAAIKARSRLDAVTPESLEALEDLSGVEEPISLADILGKGSEFWAAIRRENERRSLEAEAIRKSAAEVAKAENAVEKLLSAKGFTSVDRLKEDCGQKMVEAASARSDWRKGFADDMMLKPELDDEILRLAAGERKRLDEEHEQILQVIDKLEERENGLEQDLRWADSEPLSNIPELEDELEALEEEERRLLEEAEALGFAIRALRRAGASFSTGARGALQDKATGLLKEITEVDGRRVGVGEDYRLGVIREGSAVSPEQLSQGTRDQLYIAMRLAAASVLEDGRKVPIFMDDSFGTTDSGRLARIRRMLEKYALERQFIVLSHSEDISGWGNPIARG